MQDKNAQILVGEYQANLTLWQHDDNLRQQRYGTFLNINSLLLVVLGGLVSLAPPIGNAALVTILISLFGVPVCLMWHSIQIRNAEYIRFRRYQLRAIEAQLKPMSTFQNQWKAMNEFEVIQFPDINEEFEVKPQARRSSTMIEGRLPLVLAIFWAVVLVGSIALGLMTLLGLV